MNLASARAEELKAILANENAPEAKKVTLVNHLRLCGLFTV